MNLPEKHYYEFGPFRLDAAERQLLRAGQEIPVTPKAFQLLQMLVENSGRVLEKEALMQHVWADSFVEEKNLADNISILRKALGDDAKEPRYIKTVPRRGYRFVGEVRELAEEKISLVERTRASVIIEEEASEPPPAPAPVAAPSPAALAHAPSPMHAGRRAGRERILLVGALLLIAALAGLGLGLYKLFDRRQAAARAPVAPLQSMKFTRLPAGGGTTLGGLISPDGKFLARAVVDAGKQSLRLRMVGGATEREVVPPADGEIRASAFSPDSASLYYAFRRKGENAAYLYRVSVLGGDPYRVSSDVDDSVTVSPDGRRLGFNRWNPAKTALVVSNADGGDERTLIERQSPSLLRHAVWSPEGRVIAYAIEGSDAEGYFTNIEAAAVVDGSASVVSSARWRYVTGLAWLPDGSGLILCARDRASLPNTPTQLWHVAYPGGEAYKITNDLNFYRGPLTLTADSRTLLVGQNNLVAHVWVAPGGDAARSRQITSGGEEGYQGVAWTPDGRIVYETNASGNTDIWVANADGGGARQLTFDPTGDIFPAPSPDGRFIAFLTNRSVGWSLWRMNADGSDARELIRNISQGSSPHFSPDSRWIFYTSPDASGGGAVWKVPAEGGEPVKVLGKEVWAASLSPDGKRIAAFFRDPAPASALKILIFPAQGGDPLAAFDAPPDTYGGRLSWAPDGQAVDCVVTRNQTSNVWRLPVGGGKPRQVTDWKSDLIAWFAWSPDGKQLAASRASESNDLVMIQNFR